MKVVVRDESYTSKASFLDGDPIPEYQKGLKHSFSGYRVSRGMYKSTNHGVIHADVNGAANILRKAQRAGQCRPPKGWGSGVVVTPENLAFAW